jgi:hypothetical protein
MSNAESRLRPARYEPAQRSTLPREKPRLLVLAIVYCDGWTGREYGKNESTQKHAGRHESPTRTLVRPRLWWQSLKCRRGILDPEVLHLRYSPEH